MVPLGLLVTSQKLVVVVFVTHNVGTSKDYELLIAVVICSLIYIVIIIKLKVLSAPRIPATVQL